MTSAAGPPTYEPDLIRHRDLANTLWTTGAMPRGQVENRHAFMNLRPLGLAAEMFRGPARSKPKHDSGRLKV
jgi:hypothetical protein